MYVMRFSILFFFSLKTDLVYFIHTHKPTSFLYYSLAPHISAMLNQLPREIIGNIAAIKVLKWEKQLLSGHDMIFLLKNKR